MKWWASRCASVLNWIPAGQQCRRGAVRNCAPDLKRIRSLGPCLKSSAARFPTSSAQARNNHGSESATANAFAVPPSAGEAREADRRAFGGSVGGRWHGYREDERPEAVDGSAHRAGHFQEQGSGNAAGSDSRRGERSDAPRGRRAVQASEGNFRRLARSRRAENSRIILTGGLCRFVVVEFLRVLPVIAAVNVPIPFYFRFLSVNGVPCLILPLRSPDL